MLRTSFTALFKNATQTRRRQQRKKRPTQLEALESRLVLSAVSVEAGTLSLNADLGNDDEVTIEETGADTLRITVGGTDTFVLDAAITADPAFTLSAGNTVLDIDLAAAGIVEAEFNLNDGNDSFVATSVPETLLLAINGGEGDDTVDATSATGSVVVAGGQGNDVLSTGSGNDTLIGGDGNDELRAGDGDDQLIAGGQITITVTNLQAENGALLTPFFLATQDGAYDFFDVGGSASESLERLAEDGTTGPRINAALNSGGVNEAVATDGGPIAPGASRTITLDANSLNQLTQYLSYASMVLPSNDAFIGNDSPTELDLFDADGNLIRRTGDDAFVINGNDVYDAGTEVNDEAPANTPVLGQAAPNTGVTENGLIRQHEGFQGSARLGGTTGNVLNARPNADF
ncbi:MAG: spondin domain-containing protein, partial [Fuerstiella sp.]